MSDLKFTCPSCAQHIQVDETYAGEKIPCPGCAAVVRVPPEAPIAKAPEPVTPPPPAATTGAGVPVVPTLEENFLEESGTPLPTAPPLTEREQQIAAARAARPVIPTPAVKPRLSYILSGGQAPPRQENESALHPEHKPHEDSHPDHTKAFHE